MSATTEKQTFEFQAQVGRVLDLVIHSLYSNKEIFLRELISNASDAIDKLRFLALTDNKLYEEDADLKIRVDVDKIARQIKITDNGIGMTYEEVQEHLGTIARSGTGEFLSKLTGDQSKDSHLIGQFGVGFYSAFIVADKVTVRTRKAGVPTEQGVEWVCQGSNSYTIAPLEKSFRGTEIILHLKPDMTEFLDGYRLRGIIKKYSDHISWPVVMLQKKDEEGKSVVTEEVVNSTKALWTLPKQEISDEQYIEFYKHISHDFQEPLLWLHNRVEGKHNYISLFYIPQHAPFDLFQPKLQYGPKLCVQRVFIMESAEQLMPRYLRFVKGVIDSADLPLNVSRELLQDSKATSAIRTASVKKILDALEKLAESDAKKYQSFWNEFGMVMKEGVIEDPSNQAVLSKLLRFASTQTDQPAQEVSLQDYVQRMQTEQKHIYYLTADNFTAAKNSPHLEIFRKKGIEVLLLTDPVDEWVVGHLAEFEGKSLESVAKANLDLGEIEDKETKEAQKKAEDEMSGLLEQVKKVLDARVKDVRMTHRLTTSPACIVADEQDMGRQMQKFLKAAGQELPPSKPILELNPTHPLIRHMYQEQDDARLQDWANILLEQAILAEGEPLENPASFVERLNRMLVELSR